MNIRMVRFLENHSVPSVLLVKVRCLEVLYLMKLRAGAAPAPAFYLIPGEMEQNLFLRFLHR
ncbi:MAG: hypothetical protein D3910_09150 [Candidatus Electrothrix sp. ATG2]|nr:hypothetical protein [Candidatus Electrothrix sp. ATG2]